MSDIKYEVLEVNFSARTDTEAEVDTSIINTNDESRVTGNTTRTTTLVAHVTYKVNIPRPYEDEIGHCEVDIEKISEMVIDKDGFVLSLVTSNPSFETYDDIKDKVEDKIDQILSTEFLKEAERSHVYGYINKVQTLEGRPVQSSPRGDQIFTL